ncbi:MAG TPA: phosphatidylserine decarboxylase [Candidatus Binataceae bacterium]|nr:phosphatidylserine decarboxylase [Candidatus Binataceae bacterium]
MSFGIALVALVVLGLGPLWLGLPLLILALAVASFFRDPERHASAPADAVISAADGKVCDISEAPIPVACGQLSRRVAVFMSPANVHVNRAPVSGKVIRVEHTPGEFRAAYRDDASEHNEHNVIVLQDKRGRRHAIVQIAGYLARRIVCRVNPGDHVDRGARVGLIMFGSRVDHFFPLDYRVKVVVGDRVRAGESVLAEITANGN